MKAYREILFIRALDKLVARGGFQAAYLIGREGLVWASTKGAREQERFGALSAAAAEMFRRAELEGSGKIKELEIRSYDGDAVLFYRLRVAGAKAEEYFIAAVAETGGGDAQLVAEVAEEIKADLEAFY